MSSDINEIKATLHSIKEAKKDDKQIWEDDTASREVIARLEARINELKSGQNERDTQPENSGKK